MTMDFRFMIYLDKYEGEVVGILGRIQTIGKPLAK